MSRALRRLATAIVAVAALTALTHSAYAASVAQTIALLNAQRAANGLPAGIVEDPTLSSDCAAHDHYMAVNHQLTHVEQPGNPGYTPGGAYAGLNAVLTQNDNWDAGNPYENAPLHLDQLLAPRLAQLGSADAEGFSCTTTFPGWVRGDPPALTVYTYPGNGAQIYASEIARELPWTPGQLAGIPPGTPDGPVPDRAGRCTGSEPVRQPGDVERRDPGGTWLVRSRSRPSTAASRYRVATTSLSSYISPGGFIIPAKPLYAGVSYHAHVVVSFAGTQTPYDWTFTTLGANPHSVLTARNGRLWFYSSSPQPVSVTFTRAGGRHAPGVTIAPGRSIAVLACTG